jgi:hypothetical protein
MRLIIVPDIVFPLDSGAKNNAAIGALMLLFLPRFCSVLVTSQLLRRIFWYTIARFRNRDSVGPKFLLRRLHDDLHV